ncbi:MAG: right-handed parallel beta-helix repeat-containing protein, partial [Clostridia bacterium]|nr:right-handed parallel beta-helix repeat-containing protein [Clostridia bacterium]
MKKALSLVLTVLMLLSSVTCGLTALAAGTIITVTDLGVVANDISAASSNGTKLKNSMSSCSDGTTYVFPEGTYYVDSSAGTLGFGGKGMILSGKNNITLRGQNATIVNTSYDNTNKSYSTNSGIIVASNCSNLTIEGLNFDYQDFTSVQGVIESKGSGSVTILLDEKFTNGTYKNALTGGEFVVSINQLTDTGTPVNEVVNTSGYTATLSGNKYTISGVDNGIINALTVGKTLVARFSIGTASLPTFSLTSVKGLTVTDVNVYSTAADTFYATGANSNFKFTRLNIAPKSDSPTYWSSNVDGIHVLGISGYIEIDDCTFKGMGDDSLNSHSRAGKITAVSGKSVTCVDGWDNSAALGSNWAKSGDVIRFYKSDWTLVGTATVTSFSNKTMSFNSLPSGVDNTCFMQNTALMPKITIKNSEVDGTRARAFLIRSEDVTITDNTIKNTRLAGIIMAADITKWYEMGPSANVTISGNTFENCAVSTYNSNYGVIAIKGCDDGGGEGFAAGVHKNITIENNTFNGSSASAIYASATDGLTIKGNKYYNLSQAPHNDVATTGNSNVAIVNCTNVTTDYQDSLYQRNSVITFVDSGGESGGESGGNGEEGGESGGDDTTETVDSGNMPTKFFLADTWSTSDKRIVYEMSDGSIKFDQNYSASIGSFANSGFTTQFKAVGGFEIELRNSSASANNGYVLGYTQIKYAAEDASRHFYIRRNGSNVELARFTANALSFKENEWHTLGVYFDDDNGKTTIRVYLDGVHVKFGPGYAHENPDSFVDNTVIDGNFVDFNPIQSGKHFEINPYYTDLVAGYGSIQFRSIDATESDHLITIASVGDSITQGACATGREYSYPSELQRLLGTEKFNVVNFGRSGATLMNNTGDPYSIQNAYYRSISFAADYTVIMLGTNDSTANYWDAQWSSYNSSAEKFEADLRTLIADYTALGSKVIIMTSPASHNVWYNNVDEVVAIQKAVAADLGLDVIDMNAYTAAYGDNWATYYDDDGLHFNDAGYAKAAEYVAEYFSGMAQKADTAVTMPDKSEQVALNRETETPYDVTPVDGTFGGFTFWIANGAHSTYIGASGAQAWSYTNAYFNLGKNFEAEVTVENNINPNTTYTEGGDFTGNKYTSLSVGALEVRIRTLKNANGIKSFYYEMYMNGVKVGSTFVDGGSTAPAARMTYKIRFINGYIALYRDGTQIMTVSPATYAEVRDTADYNFAGVRVGFGTFELGAYHRVSAVSLETYPDVPSDYSITATVGGKIMEGDAEFAGTESYLPGESVTLTAVAEDNYLFNGWYNSNGTLLSSDATYTVIFEPTTIIKARFIEKTVTGMSITATVGGKITENGADFTTDGHYVTTSVTLTAVATDSAYKFAYWTLDGKIVSYQANYTVTFTESGALVAVFADELDQELASTLVNIKTGYEAGDWTVTGDGATLKNGGIYAGNGSKANNITAIYNSKLNLSNGFNFATKFTWGYGVDGGVNYWANSSKFNFGALTFKIINSQGTGTKKPVIYELYNGDVLLGSFDTGYYATNGSYNTAIEEFLNSTFTITYDGANIKVHSSALDANNDGTAGEYVVWTLADGSTAESVAVGEVDLHEATIKLEKEWGGSNFTNVLYYSELVIDTAFPFLTVDSFDAYLNNLNDSYNATSVAEARAYYDAVSDEIKAELNCAHALFAAEAALAGETYNAVYEITAENGGKVYAGDVLIENATILYGETVTITAVGQGMQFVGWYDENDNLVSNVASMDVRFINTVKLTAKFEGEAAMSDMTVTSTAGGKVTVNGEDYVSDGHYVGDAVTLTATVTDSAYQFAYWTIDGVIVSYEKTYVLTYTAEGTVTAVFNTVPDGEVIGGFVAEDWTVTGNNASIKDGGIYAGDGAKNNDINAVYKTALDLSGGFKFTTKFTWAYSIDGGVNYWGNASYFQFGALKFRITNSYGTGTKRPVIYELLNGDAVIAKYDTGYYASNGSYSTAIEEYLNSTFTVEFDGEKVKVFSSALDANNDGVAGEYVVWTVSETTTSEAVAVGDIDLSNAVMSLEKKWGGSNFTNVLYFDNFSIELPAKHPVSVTGRNGRTTTVEVMNGTKITLADIVPFTYGYNVVGWKTADGIEITADTVIVTETLSLVPVFEVVDNDGGYTVVVEGASNTTGGKYFYNSKITLEFDTVLLGENEYFGGWINAATGAVISYAKTYIFYVGADTTIEALVVSEEATPAPVVAITDVCDINGDGSNWSF